MRFKILFKSSKTNSFKARLANGDVINIPVSEARHLRADSTGFITQNQKALRFRLDAINIT